MSKSTFREKLERALEIPSELLKNCPRISMIGNEKIFIENYKAITEYEENIVRIGNYASIYGEKLTIAEITSDEILISGKIKRVEFEN